jgi:hypothetical protein
MNIMSKSLLAIDDFILNASEDEKNRIWLEVKEMNIEGPTLEQYFSWVFENNPVRFQFQEGIEPCLLKSSQGNFQLIYQTPKFPLESFFCNIAIWKRPILLFFS